MPEQPQNRPLFLAEWITGLEVEVFAFDEHPRTQPVDVLPDAATTQEATQRLTTAGYELVEDWSPDPEHAGWYAAKVRVTD
ncbi:hypothetical protein [Nocardia blacklockiae]|uniref:hypothetical protein n=1 Tax=Nocardia blacklockiae TaxID=480036 RepID=UPI0018955443|nr:hypothetical protein [Nocardia blacklockiae]MBF6171106.1 hypothetical protein [Nocardia blacklockiae]